MIVGRYLWGTLQSHRVMDKLLRDKFQKHLEVALHMTFYLFDHRSQRVEFTALNNKVGSQDKTISKM